MHLVLDAVVLAVAGICLALGWRRGFIDSVKGLVEILVVLVVRITCHELVHVVTENSRTLWSFQTSFTVETKTFSELFFFGYGI